MLYWSYLFIHLSLLVGTMDRDSVFISIFLCLAECQVDSRNFTSICCDLLTIKGLLSNKNTWISLFIYSGKHPLHPYYMLSISDSELSKI